MHVNRMYCDVQVAFWKFLYFLSDQRVDKNDKNKIILKNIKDNTCARIVNIKLFI